MENQTTDQMKKQKIQKVPATTQNKRFKYLGKWNNDIRYSAFHFIRENRDFVRFQYNEVASKENLDGCIIGKMIWM